MKRSHFGLAFAAIAGVTTASASASSESESASSLFDIFSNAAEDNNTTVISDIAALIQQPGSTNGPSSIESAFSTIQKEFSDQQFTIEEAAHRILKAGLIPEDILSLLNGYLDDELNSLENNNPPPKKKIYPTKSTEDAPYSIKEEALRSAIHIHDTFEYGQFNKTPLILVPGTAIPAGTTFTYNFAKLNKITPKADIVWVNLPKASLSDAQSNAEYIAYAINYISTQCNNKPVTVLSWSQGGLNVQWALKYWPSTREIVKDFIALSPGFPRHDYS